MKRLMTIFAISLLALYGCEGNKQPADELITVDVTASYPWKELVLQDFMDVEYIPLETNDEFLCRGFVRAVGHNHVIATNRNNDGNIYIFDRNGKALRIINKKGGSGDEYNHISSIVLNEENNEMFINDTYAKKILVLDLEGNLKRKLLHKSDFLFYEMFNFDQDNLICHDTYNEYDPSSPPHGQAFMLISKQDGRITKELQIPYKEKETIIIKTQPDEVTGMFYSYSPSSINPIMPYFNDYVLVELSADTIYKYSPDHTMAPIIERTPSIHSMNPQEFLIVNLLTDHYYFMEAIIKNMDYEATNLLYDKQEKAIFRYKVYNDDYTYKKEAYLKSRPLNGEIPSCQFLEADELIRDYKRGKLKGKLKDVAANLEEDSNPVIMLIKHKK